MKYTLAVRRYVTRTCVWLFGEESACTAGRWALGVRLFGDNDDGPYIKNRVPWKSKHRAGPLD